nr:NlpC/P60 family protein [Alsobacter ponti]
MAEARRWIGTPYRHAASLRGVGCDCLGLARGVWRALHGAEPEPPPPYAPDWAEAGGTEALRDALARWLATLPPDAAEPGDVLLFRFRAGAPAKHLGVMSAPGRMIHAQEGASVAETPFGVWRRRLVGVFRFPDPARPSP